jgi:hypothetical protein
MAGRVSEGFCWAVLQGNGRVTCPQHVFLVASEPIIPVPGDDFDNDDGRNDYHPAQVGSHSPAGPYPGCCTLQ